MGSLGSVYTTSSLPSNQRHIDCFLGLNGSNHEWITQSESNFSDKSFTPNHLKCYLYNSCIIINVMNYEQEGELVTRISSCLFFFPRWSSLKLLWLFLTDLSPGQDANKEYFDSQVCRYSINIELLVLYLYIPFAYFLISVYAWIVFLRTG